METRLAVAREVGMSRRVEVWDEVDDERGREGVLAGWALSSS